MTRKVTKVFLGLAVVLLLFTSATAWAAPTAPSSGGGQAVSVCGTSTTARPTQWLPVERWSEATTSFHYRLDADGWNDLAEKINRNGRDAAFMQIGNASWRLGADALYASSTFCPLQILGRPLDSLVGTVGKALSASGVVAALVVVTVGTALVGVRRGDAAGHVLAETLKTGAVLGLMSTMVLGAASSTDAAPGKGSPWWWVQQANTVVNSVSSKLASAAINSTSSPLGYQPLYPEEGTASDWPVTCTTTGEATGYVDWLHKQYNASYAQDGSADARASALPEMVSTMWEAGVLPVWAASQFGSDNPYTDHVYCFFLEARSHATTASNEDLQSYLGERLGMTVEMQDHWGAASKSQISQGGNGEDQSLLGWAACIPSAEGATPRGDWVNTIAEKTNSEHCKTWWVGGERGANLNGTSLDWDEKSVSKKAAGSAGVYNYVASVHGKGGTQVGGVMFAYLIGSLVSGGILLLLSVLQLASKLVVAFMVVGLFFALVRSLTPGDDGLLFRRTGLQLVGAAFVSSCAGLMIAVIMMVAGAVSRAGAEFFSPGTTGAVLATCMGPAAGVLLLHWLFKSVMHVPSPFSIKGAMAWGQGITSGVIGGAVGAGVVGLASNARETARRATGRHDMRPRPGDGRRKPGEIDPDKATRGGTNRSLFTARSATERLRQGEERKRLLDEARTEREDRRQKVEDEARRLARADGHLGEPDAWKDYTGKARARLRRASSDELKASFASAGRDVLGLPGRGVRAVGRGAAQTAARAGQGLDAAGALAGWATHHPARAAAATGVAGWRTAAAGARAAASGAGALRAMPAKKAVAAGAAAALAAGAVPVAAGILAAGAGAGWVRRSALAAPAPGSAEAVEAVGLEEALPPVSVEAPVQPGAGAVRMERVDELVARLGTPVGTPPLTPTPEAGDELALQVLERMKAMAARNQQP
ncbi:hypothetical protein [Actinomyces gaoshouyii]|uniref:hypothetical protein n=1 Tax=Actinomyces gaoshouyii TaxID=1960083 RepID=UPI0009BF0AB1|nr:hypothetical protein [Actinomyces gaoshouyii]ARD42521.1 hypothetical protein B6G06_09340 [Actinomyces gaoshouyii]